MEEGGTSWVDPSTYTGNIGELCDDPGEWYGGCYVDGYFYIVHAKLARVARSKDGKIWKLLPDFKVADGDKTFYYNITYYKNKLYMVNEGGTYCYIGTFE